MINKRKILVSAYACEPLKGSEQAVGWNWVLQMAKSNEIYVITRANNQQVIEENLPKDVADNVAFYYYDAPVFIKKLKKKDKGLYFYNFVWNIGLLPLAKRIIREYQVDYTMHLTFGNIWMPTFLPLLKVPFIWGPIGGGEGIPVSFIKTMPFKQRIVQGLRYLLKATTILNPFIFLSSFKSVAILARTQNTVDIIPFCFRSKVRLILETAIEEYVFAYKKRKNDTNTVQMIISARLIAIKNIPTAIKSLKYIPADKKYHLTIIGTGLEKNTIEEEIQKNNCGDKVTIIPFMPRQEALKVIEESDIFLFPSLKEGGSWALMEAMAIGLPVICLNWTGMAISTDDTCAILLPVTNPEQMPKDMAAAICKLIDNPKLREQMGNAGRERIKTVFNWESKGIFMENLLNELDMKNKR
jgi:glycosyltransferase involved in cell wall biosynthesis